LAAPVSAATLCVRPGGAGGCYANIQDALNAAGDGDTIEVDTGTYNESVDLAQAAGDITVLAGDGPGTVTVNGGGNDAFHTSVAHAGNVTIDGFVVHSNGFGIRLELVGDADIRNVTANSTGDSGIGIGPAGDVSISDCTTNDTAGFGIGIGISVGDVTITNCTANNNARGGIVVQFTDAVTITNCTANGNVGAGIGEGGSGDVTVTNSTANGNTAGISFQLLDDFTVTNCTTNNNWVGILVRSSGNVTIFGSVAQGNDQGVRLGPDVPSGSVNGSIICGNDCGLDLRDAPVSGLNAEANWWGCAGGPDDTACDRICQEDSVAVDFDPWIDTITASGPASVLAGNPAEVTFQFSGGDGTVFLGEGPGDLHGAPTFVVSTDNGTVIDPGFINEPDGILAATLIPAFGDTATVWVDGPCGLDAEVGVEAWEFVPEPGSVILLASGLMGLAGYAGLRLRKK
jgi:parallel beta-helix repeat protein